MKPLVFAWESSETRVSEVVSEIDLVYPETFVSARPLHCIRQVAMPPVPIVDGRTHLHILRAGRLSTRAPAIRVDLFLLVKSQCLLGCSSEKVITLVISGASE